VSRALESGGHPFAVAQPGPKSDNSHVGGFQSIPSIQVLRQAANAEFPAKIVADDDHISS
jgi:hypothetical protein